MHVQSQIQTSVEGERRKLEEMGGNWNGREGKEGRKEGGIKNHLVIDLSIMWNAYHQESVLYIITRNTLNNGVLCVLSLNTLLDSMVERCLCDHFIVGNLYHVTMATAIV